jgi:hypothetical protein
VAYAKCRKLSQILRECGISRERVVEILDQDDEDDSIAFVAKYRSLPKSDVKHMTTEAVALAAGLTTRRLWELIQGTRLEQSQDAVKMLVADSRAAVMTKTLASAKEGDLKAVELIWKADGTLPKSNGISLVLSQNNASMPVVMAPPEEEDVLPLADMDSMLKEMQRVTSSPRLEAPQEPKSVPIIDAEYETVDN